MIQHGKLTAYSNNFFGYVAAASQHEAEEISDGDYQNGIIIFIPFPLSYPLEYTVESMIQVRESRDDQKNKDADQRHKQHANE